MTEGNVAHVMEQRAKPCEYGGLRYLESIFVGIRLPLAEQITGGTRAMTLFDNRVEKILSCAHRPETVREARMARTRVNQVSCPELANSAKTLHWRRIN